MVLAGRICRAGAQKQMYRDIAFQIPDKPDWVPRLLAFLDSHPVVASYIQTLSLECYDLGHKQAVDVKSISDILARLKGLQELDMLSLTWLAPSSTPTFPEHPSLRVITMMGMDVTELSATPLHLLRLKTQWDKVELDYVDHVDGNCASYAQQPVPVNCLSILHYPFYNNKLSLPGSFNGFCDVVTLRADYLTNAHAECLERIVRMSFETLQVLRFTVSPYESGECDQDIRQ